MFIIKVKIKGFLKNLTEKEEEIIDTQAIKNSNNLTYNKDDIKHKIIVSKNKIILVRENNEFSHEIIFEENRKHSSEYYLKNSNYSLEFNILTTKLSIQENKIDIMYKILESNNKYNYVLEVSDNI